MIKERVSNLVQLAVDEPSKMGSVVGVLVEMFIEMGNINSVTSYAASQSLSSLNSVSNLIDYLLELV